MVWYVYAYMEFCQHLSHHWNNCVSVIVINTLRPRQNGRHFPDDIFKWILLNENVWISIRLHWSLILGVQLAISQHWFRQWLGADQATSHYLIQWRLVCIHASLGLNELYTSCWSVHSFHFTQDWKIALWRALQRECIFLAQNRTN